MDMSGWQHSPDIPASRPRHAHLVERARRKAERSQPKETEKPWTSLGGVAPLWAACAFCDKAAKARGAALTYHDQISWEMISVSLWLADFAYSLNPSGLRQRSCQGQSDYTAGCPRYGRKFPAD
jgi:hypothetical protein